MAKQLKKYVAYDPETHMFKGFFNEGRKDLPSDVHEVNRATFMQDIGFHTHYNPNTRKFYTPEADTLKKKLMANTTWRNSVLAITDKYMLEDFPITDQQRIELKQFRQDLRDFDKTGDRLEIPYFIEL